MRTGLLVLEVILGEIVFKVGSCCNMFLGEFGTALLVFVEDLCKLTEASRPAELILHVLFCCEGFLEFIGRVVIISGLLASFSGK